MFKFLRFGMTAPCFDTIFKCLVCGKEHNRNELALLCIMEIVPEHLSVVRGVSMHHSFRGLGFSNNSGDVLK
jgi:hypothetical protein